jgi:ABC-type antimicrobial peptide transport system permease subunit
MKHAFSHRSPLSTHRSALIAHRSALLLTELPMPEWREEIRQLGAQAGNVLALVIRQGMQPALIGLGAGLLGAFGLMRLLASQLYEVQATNPLTFAMVAIGLLLIAFAACYIPARRATKIDPMAVLRYE